MSYTASSAIYASIRQGGRMAPKTSKPRMCMHDSSWVMSKEVSRMRKREEGGHFWTGVLSAGFWADAWYARNSRKAKQVTINADARAEKMHQQNGFFTFLPEGAGTYQ